MAKRPHDTMPKNIHAALTSVARSLESIDRTLRNLKMRDDVIEFGADQLRRRVTTLERQAARASRKRSR